MSFKYSCYIENTPEIREWLEKIGYEVYSNSKSAKYIVTVPLKSMVFGSVITEWAIDTFDNESYIDLIHKNSINCLGNPQLFKAVSAVRDRSDFMQWFVIDRINGATEEFQSEFRLCKKEKFDINEVPLYGIIDYYKASLSKLQERFKIK